MKNISALEKTMAVLRFAELMLIPFLFSLQEVIHSDDSEDTEDHKEQSHGPKSL